MNNNKSLVLKEENCDNNLVIIKNKIIIKSFQ